MMTVMDVYIVEILSQIHQVLQLHHLSMNTKVINLLKKDGLLPMRQW